MQLNDLLPSAILIGVTIVGLTVLSNIVQTVYNGQTAATVAKNVSGQGLLGLKELGLWMPTIALVIAAGLIIGILISAFAFGRK